MKRKMSHQHAPSERRKFERVDIARSSQVLVLETKGKKIGVLRQIGRGGFMMEPQHAFHKDDKTHKFTIHEPEEKIQIEVHARVLYAHSELVGFEFVDLDPNAAVDLGIVIGKYYEHEKSKNP